MNDKINCLYTTVNALYNFATPRPHAKHSTPARLLLHA